MIVSKSNEKRSFQMKSIEIKFYGQSEIRSYLRVIYIYIFNSTIYYIARGGRP